MSESIQNFPTRTACGVTIAPDTIRRDFIRRAADLYGRPVATDLAELDGHDDIPALLLAFPWLTDAELVEAAWALGAARTDF